MTVHITSRNTTIRDPFKKSLEKKLSKLDRFFEPDTAAYVTVTNEGSRETVEVTVRDSGMIFRAEKTTGDRLDSLDAVVDALFKQIVKNKTKLEKKMRKSAFVNDYEQDYVGTEEDYKIVKTKHFNLKPMDVEEAILQMNLLGHSFFMFRNSTHGEISVVYKRQGGDYGLLEHEE
ncbi:ribosome-associated translation inhibitor RaiA [Oscillospiraceae bacterium MB08-C2-2]|nr:ribosome-associated translation inhibitor RaiA [Oscillospiraceae bacterium MB08-C2-2]